MSNNMQNHINMQKQINMQKLLERSRAYENFSSMRNQFINTAKELLPDTSEGNGALYRSVSDSEPTTKRTRTEELSNIDHLLEAMKIEPTDDAAAKKMFATTEMLVDSICNFRKVLSSNDSTKLDDLNCECPGNFWIGYEMGKVAATNLKIIDAMLKTPCAFNSGDCPICLEQLDSKETTVTICKHAFHKSCMSEWTQMAGSFARCPLCMATIIDEGAQGHKDQQAQQSDEDDEQAIYRNPNQVLYRSLPASQSQANDDSEEVYRTLPTQYFGL